MAIKKLTTFLPVDIDPNPIENGLEMDVVHSVRSRCTFRIADDRSRQYPCIPNWLHCATKLLHLHVNSVQVAHFPDLTTYIRQYISVNRFERGGKNVNKIKSVQGMRQVTKRKKTPQSGIIDVKDFKFDNNTKWRW